MDNIWDEDTVSEYELLADDAEEAERIAEEYDKTPEILEASEEEVEQLTEEAAFDLDQEESNVVYNARLRLEQARLYEMLVNHNLFEGVEADPRAINIVQNELKHFIVKRLEILMGLRQPVIEKATEIAEIDLPFNDVEINFLKQLAYKGTLGKSAQGQPMQVSQKPKGINPLSSSNKKSSLKSIKNTTPKKTEKSKSQSKVTSTPKKKQQTRKKVKPQPKAKPAKRSEINSSGVMRKRNLSKKEIEELARKEIEEEKKRPKKPWAKMSKKEKMERIKEVNEKYARPKPKDMLPMPTYNELEMKYQQREMSRASKGGMDGFNSTLANILLKRKEEGE